MTVKITSWEVGLHSVYLKKIWSLSKTFKKSIGTSLEKFLYQWGNREFRYRAAQLVYRLEVRRVIKNSVRPTVQRYLVLDILGIWYAGRTKTSRRALAACGSSDISVTWESMNNLEVTLALFFRTWSLHFIRLSNILIVMNTLTSMYQNATKLMSWKKQDKIYPNFYETHLRVSINH